MDATLSLIAIAVVIAGGCGVTLLVFARKEPIELIELLSLSIFFGMTSVTVSMFVLGYVIRHPLLTAVIAIGQIALFVVAIVKWRRGAVRIERPRIIETLVVLAIVGVEAVFLAWTAFHAELGWDGMVIWDLKSHLIAINGGHLPISHMNDLRMQWTHNAYPLLFPMAKAWLYLWMGHTHQQLGKLVEVLFFIAAAMQIYSGVRRMTGSITGAFAGMLLLFAIPFIYIGDGSIGSGLADFPMAAFYLAAMRYVGVYAMSGSRRDLMLAGTLAGIGCWVKQDGSLLWMVVALLALLLSARWRERWTWIAAALAPGLFVLVAWKLFRAAIHVAPETVYMPATIENFLQHQDRLGLSIGELLNQLTVYMTWSVLWYAVPVAALTLIIRFARRQRFALLGGVLMPMMLYCAVYVFTNWDPLVHIRTSLSRLLLSPALVAVLFVGVAAGQTMSALRHPLFGAKRSIALLTDFGSRDPYVASMKGVLASRTSAAISDLSHEIAPQDIVGAARFLQTAQRWWPAGTLFVAVVDPGVGTDRRILTLTHDDKIFIAPDNGLLSFIPRDRRVRSVENASLFLPDGSHTFHGRDRFAPLAAALAEGLPMNAVGPVVEDMVLLDPLRGAIVAIDRFGNAITDLEAPSVPFALKTGKRTIDRLCRTYDEGGSDPFLIVGSNGTIEISIRGGSAADALGLRRGDRVELIM